MRWLWLKVAKYERQPVVYVDVDGTLLLDGEINRELVDWCRLQHANGMELVLWSMAGRQHALQVAERAGIVDVFSAILSKPGYIVDDDAWRWVRFAKVINPLRLLSLSK